MALVNQHVSRADIAFIRQNYESSKWRLEYEAVPWLRICLTAD